MGVQLDKIQLNMIRESFCAWQQFMIGEHGL